MPAIIVMLIVALASRLLMGAINTLTKSDKDKNKSAALGHLVTKRSSKEILRLAYGTCRLGINECYIGTAGSENKSLYVIGILGEGPIAGILRADGSVFDTPDTTFPTSNPPLLYIDGILWTEHAAAGQITARYYAGTSDQGLCPLSSAIPEWTDKLRHTAYLYLRFYYDQDQWVGMPEVTVTVAGLKLLDPNTGAIALSTNPALVVYDMLTRPSARGGMGLGGWHEAGPIVYVYASDFANWGCLSNCSVAPGGFSEVVSDMSLERSSAMGSAWTSIKIVGTTASGATVNLYDSGGSVAQTFTGVESGDELTIDWDGATPGTRMDVYGFSAVSNIYISTTTGGDGSVGTVCDRIDIASVETARAYCATKGWTYNAPIDEDTYFADNLQLVLNCFRGEIVYSEGLFKLRFRDLTEESVSMALTSDDVVANDDGTSSLSLAPAGDFFDLPNAVKAVFINSEKKYLEDVYTLEDSAAGLTDETVDLRETEIKLYGLNTLDLVQQMAAYALERARWGHLVTFSARDKCMRLEAGDVVTLTHDTPGWTAQPLRVLSTSFDPQTHTVALECIEEDEDLYDDAYLPSELQSATVNMPSPLDPVPDVLAGSLSEEVYYYRGRSFTRLLVDFSPPDDDLYPWFDYAEIYVKIGDGDWRYMTKSKGDYQIDPAEEGETYQVRIRAVNVWGVKRALAQSMLLVRTVVGKTDAPPDLAGVSGSVNGDTVTLMATPLTDPDIDGYEVRLGEAWESGIFIAYSKAPTLRLVGVRPGTHTFWVASKGNNGVYCDNPVDVTVTVFIPAWLTYEDDWAWDYDGIGTHSNTEHTTYNSADALICSHTSGVLTGTWTSPTYDLGSVLKVRLWGDFTGAFSSGDATFDGVFSTTRSFEDVDPGGTLTFAEIFASMAAAQVQATLYHSEDNSNWSEVGYFEILCAEVEARYVKVAITITDPTDDSNYYLAALSVYAYTGPA